MLINCANVRTRICIINVVCVGRVARCCKTLNFIINRTTKKKWMQTSVGKCLKQLFVRCIKHRFSGQCYLEVFESLRKYLNFLFIEYELGNGKGKYRKPRKEAYLLTRYKITIQLFTLYFIRSLTFLLNLQTLDNSFHASFYQAYFRLNSANWSASHKSSVMS